MSDEDLCPALRGRQQFLPRNGQRVKEGLHRRFAIAPSSLMRTRLVVLLHPNIEIALQLVDGPVDSSLRDVKQDDSNNEVAPSRSGEQIDDVLDGVVGAVVGGFESAVWAMLRVRTAVEAAVGKWSAQLFVEEQK